MKKIKISKRVAALLKILPVASVHAMEDCLSQLRKSDQLLPDEEPFTKERSVLLLRTWDLVIIRRYQQQWGWHTQTQVEVENLIPADEMRAFILAKTDQANDKSDPLHTAVELLVKGTEKTDRYKKLVQTVIGIIMGLSAIGSQAGSIEKLIKGESAPVQSDPAPVQPVTPPK